MTKEEFIEVIQYFDANTEAIIKFEETVDADCAMSPMFNFYNYAAYLFEKLFNVKAEDVDHFHEDFWSIALGNETQNSPVMVSWEEFYDRYNNN